jgi:hypothetical protein
VTPPDSTRALAGAVLATDLIEDGARLVVLEGLSAGRELPLRDGAVLGRARRAELHIDDPLASRRHLRFSYRDGRWTVADLASKNGLTINGDHPETPATLSPGDRLTLGATVLAFQDAAERAGAPQQASTPTARPRGESLAGAPAVTGLRAGSVSSAHLLAAAALLALAVALALAAARG